MVFRRLRAGLLLLPVLAMPAAADNTVKVKSIHAAKTASARISHLADVAFQPSSTAPAPQQIAVCIYSNSGGRYRLTALSSNGSGAEMRLRGGTAFVVYRAIWHAGPVGSGVELASGLTTALLAGADPSSETCGGGTNARLEIALDGASYAAAPPGSYLDVLSLSVAPD